MKRYKLVAVSAILAGIWSTIPVHAEEPVPESSATPAISRQKFLEQMKARRAAAKQREQNADTRTIQIEVPNDKPVTIRVLPNGDTVISSSTPPLPDYHKDWDLSQETSFLSFPWPVIPSDFGARKQLGVIEIRAGSTPLADVVKVDDEQLAQDERLVLQRHKLLSSRAINKLNFADQLKLLSTPELTLTSRYAPSFFNTRQLLVLRPQHKDVCTALLIDLANLRTRTLYAPPGQNIQTAHTYLIKQALLPTDEAQLQVISDSDKAHYHRLGAPDLNAKNAGKVYPNIVAAQTDSLSGCPQCFPNEEQAEASKIGAMRTSEAQDHAQREDPLQQMRLPDPCFDQVYQRLLERNSIADIRCSAYLLGHEDYGAFPYYSSGPIYLTAGLYRHLETPGELAAALAHELANVILGYVDDSRTSHFDDPYRPWILTKETRDYLASLETLRDIYSYASLSASWAFRHCYWGYMPAPLAYGDSYSNHEYFELGKKQSAKADNLAAVMCYIAGYDPEDYRRYVQKVGELAPQAQVNGNGDINLWLLGNGDSARRLKALEPTLQGLSVLDKQIAKVSQRDPGLGQALRSRAASCLENPEATQRFIEAYKSILPAE